MTLPVSDQLVESTNASMQSALPVSNGVDDERPPQCPSCHKRLVILATHSVREQTGEYMRQQLWGCPKGHATAVRRGGSFSQVELLGELAG